MGSGIFERMVAEPPSGHGRQRLGLGFGSDSVISLFFLALGLAWFVYCCDFLWKTKRGLELLSLFTVVKLDSFLD
jgi:hypothetical protein